LACQIRLMIKKDIPQVTVIDREAFPTMWPPVNFHHELSNRLAHYAVACDGNQLVTIPVPKPAIRLVPVRSFLGLRWPFRSNTDSVKDAAPEIVEFITGFVGLWIMVDEAHIINIAVREGHRSKGIGELLLIASIDLASQLKASIVTLEVRSSNTVAQNLYVKYGFSKMGVRRGYYTDNREDAFIMTTDIITSDSFQRQFRDLKAAHFQKMADLVYKIPI
jgi:ribosomal-protein-alanine N-acetyltransferase